jgi:hypothetical protein
MIKSRDEIIQVIQNRRETARYYVGVFSKDGYDSSAEQQQAIADSMTGVLREIGVEE